MNTYKTSKKIRYTLSILFVLFMTFIVGGTYLSQQQKEATKNASSVESLDTTIIK